MEGDESEVQRGEMVITAEYSRIKSECKLGEELPIEYESVIKQEPPEVAKPEVEQEYDTGECDNDDSDYVNSGKQEPPEVAKPEVEQEYDTGECENDDSDYVNSGNTSKSSSEKSESSSDEESVANLARSWRRKQNKKQTKLKIAEINIKKTCFKGKYAMRSFAFKHRSKILVDRFLSGPEGTLIPIKYKEVVLMKTNQKGYSAPDGQLERFKKLVNEKELYCCEECDYTSEYLKIFNIHFLAHANIHFIQECIGVYPCHLCHFQCENSGELRVHIETDHRKYAVKDKRETRSKSTIKVKKETQNESTIIVQKETHVMEPLVKVERLDFPSTDVHWQTEMESKVFQEDNLYSDGDAHCEDAKQHNPLPDEDLYSAEVKDMLEDDKSLLIKNSDPMQFVSVVNIKKEIKEEDSEIIFKEEESNGDYNFELPAVNALGNPDIVEKPPAVVESNCAKKVSVKKKATVESNCARKMSVKKKPRAKLKSNSDGEVRKVKRIYGPRPLLKCDKCGYSTKYRKLINRHKCRTSFACSYCHQECSNHPEYVQHVKSHQNFSIGRLGKHYQCKICCSLFNRRDTTKSHIHRQHCDQEKKLCGQHGCLHGKVLYECNECGKKFSTKFAISSHLDHRHSIGRIYKCSVCNLDFNSGYSMRNHKKKHSCLHCPFQSESQEEVLKHRQSHVNSVEKPMLCCEFCQYQTTVVKRFEVHTSKHKITTKQTFKCSQCEFTSNQKGNLAIHEKSHIVTDGYTCTICNFNCRRIVTFKRHKLSHGLDESTLMMVDPSKRDERFQYCEKCEYKSKYPQLLKTHMLKHDNIRPHLCAECGASFSCIMVFTAHKKSHTAVKNMYKCRYCNYKYHMKATVLIHERKHTGEKPYVCDLCNYCTSYVGNLSNHRKKHFTNKINGGLIKPPKPSLE